MLPTVVSSLTILVAICVVVLSRRLRTIRDREYKLIERQLQRRNQLLRDLDEHVGRRVRLARRVDDNWTDEPNADPIGLAGYPEPDLDWLSGVCLSLTPEDTLKSLRRALAGGVLSNSSSAMPPTQLVRKSVKGMCVDQARGASLVEKFGGVSFVVAAGPYEDWIGTWPRRNRGINLRPSGSSLIASGARRTA